ncbi:MAG: amidohydrolase family protein [Candidatus Woesearchaeota archaeon]
MSILIENGQLFIEGRLVHANLVISGSKIEGITQQKVSCDDYIDATGKIVLPGIIDPHVHFREPGMTYKEDFLSGSRAAAAGGVTTIIDMPNTVPATTTVQLLGEKRELAKKSVVNYAFHFGAAKGNLNEIRAARNIASVKLFMNLSTGNLMVDDEAAKKQIFQNSKLVSVHAELEKVSEAIGLVIDTKNKLYLCHLSTASEISFLEDIPKNKVFAEVTPHHLFLSDADDKDNFTKMKPQLRKKEDQDALWKAIETGIIDTIGSDHAPHTIQEKKQKGITYGVPGVETSLPLMLNAVNKGRLSLKRLVEMCCENPARIFCIQNKGFIRKGFDADLVIIDMALEKQVQNQELFTKCLWSPFHCTTLTGWPVMTIVNGKVVFDNGKIYEHRATELVLGGKNGYS